jgi:hypothetical protein
MKFFYFLIAIGMLSSILANEVALVKKLKGSAHVLREGKEVAVEVGTKLFEKDIIFTNPQSSLGLIFNDNTRISVGAKSEFSIEKYLFVPSENKEAFVSNLSTGSMECITGLIAKINPDAFKIKAKTATMGIRGTHFIITAE